MRRSTRIYLAIGGHEFSPLDRAEHVALQGDLAAPTAVNRRLVAVVHGHHCGLAQAAARNRSPVIQRSISASARAASALLGDRLRGALESPSVGGARRNLERRKQSEVDVHGLNERGPASIVSTWPPVIWPSSAPCAVVAGWHDRQTASFLSRKAARKEPDCGGFHIAFAARDPGRQSVGVARRSAEVCHPEAWAN